LKAHGGHTGHTLDPLAFSGLCIFQSSIDQCALTVPMNVYYFFPILKIFDVRMSGGFPVKVTARGSSTATDFPIEEGSV